MPRFEPFVGLRYDPGVVPLEEAIAPPYDVVSPAERADLAGRSAFNSIHVELPEPDEVEGLDRYEHAAAILESWEQELVVRRDEAPTYYIYRMRFVDESGEERSTTGVIGALGIDTESSGQVLPHERTTPKPKGDRLDLLRATGTNLSPIWGLSLSPGLTAACIAATGGRPAPLHAVDDEGIVHELWTTTDQGAIEAITGLVASTPVVIADGHHRYETAGFYRNEQRSANGDRPGPYDLVMALVVELTAEELFVRPIHRLISGLPPETDLAEALAPYFSVTGGPGDLHELTEEMGRRGGLGLVTATGNHLLIPLPAVEEAAEADLDSSRLDVALADLPAHELVYQHGLDHVAEAVASGRAEAGILLRPATVAQIAETAHSGRRMPPKTTFFHPKPRTGMVFRPVGRPLRAR